MQNGGFVSWDEWKPILNGFNCPCCTGVRLVPTEEELEQITTELIERERVKNAILSLEIESLKKAVEQVENVSGLHSGS
jgi:hypothetical protein